MPDFFKNKKVLDVGSGDINGNNRYLFDNCNYTGNDVIPSKNVDVVSKTKDLKFEKNTFDTIISTECFEHDPEYKQSIQKIYDLLKPDGLFVFTCASTGRAEHGTTRTTPQHSLGSLGKIPDMMDYYKNLTIKDINEALDIKKSFSSFETYYHYGHKDLFFIGIKNGSGSVKISDKFENQYTYNTNHNIK
jgi:SAM-dependent methyltransferase